MFSGSAVGRFWFFSLSVLPSLCSGWFGARVCSSRASGFARFGVALCSSSGSLLRFFVGFGLVRFAFGSSDLSVFRFNKMDSNRGAFLLAKVGVGDGMGIDVGSGSGLS